MSSRSDLGRYRPGPDHPPLTPVLLEVVLPLELDSAAGDEFPVTLDALDIREVHETDTGTIGSRNCPPALIAVPKGDRAASHEGRIVRRLLVATIDSGGGFLARRPPTRLSSRHRGRREDRQCVWLA